MAGLNNLTFVRGPDRNLLRTTPSTTRKRNTCGATVARDEWHRPTRSRDISATSVGKWTERTTTSVRGTFLATQTSSSSSTTRARSLMASALSRRFAVSLCANVSETVAPVEIRVEGGAKKSHDDPSTDRYHSGGRGGPHGTPTAVQRQVQVGRSQTGVDLRGPWPVGRTAALRGAVLVAPRNVAPAAGCRRAGRADPEEARTKEGGGGRPRSQDRRIAA